MSSNAQHRFTNASLQFVPAGDVGPYVFVDKPADEETAKKNFSVEETPVLIENLRMREGENSVTLDVEGFQLFSDSSTIFKDFNNEEEIVRVYYPESADIVKNLIGASQVVAFDHTRRRHEVGDNPTRVQPSRRVHVDYSPSESIAVLRQLFPAKENSVRRFQVLSFWRAISHPAYDSPVVLCDYRTVNMQKDLVPVRLVLPHKEVEVVSSKYNENHKWGYFYAVRPEEVLLIKAYDSAEDDSIAFCCPHTSFEDPATPKGSPLRESIELRMLVFYE